MKDKALKESIIAEYLTAGLSYRQVAEKRGVDYRSLHRWVKQYQGRMKKSIPTYLNAMLGHKSLHQHQ